MTTKDVAAERAREHMAVWDRLWLPGSGVRRAIAIPGRGLMDLLLDAKPAFVRDSGGHVVGIDAMVRLFDSNGDEVTIDPHRRFINPPVLLADRARDPLQAFYEMLADSITTAPNAVGWRTRGTVDTFFSNANDDRVRNTSTTYNTAADGTGTQALGGVTATQNAVGQEFSTPNYTCYQLFFDWDTSAIADTDVVSAAVFSLYCQADSSTTDFTVEIFTYDFSTSVDAGDFRTATQLGALTKLATASTVGISTAAYTDFTDTGNSAAAVNKTGSTRVVVASDRQRTKATPTGTEYVFFFEADNTGTTKDPKLVVTHAAPVAGKGRPLVNAGLVNMGLVNGGLAA